MQSRSPAAFTLVELLVVIAMIGVMISMMLAGVQSAREATRRASCQGKLAQLGLALHNYEAAHLTLPPGSLDAQGPVAHVAAGYHHGWLTQILPYLDHAVTERHIDRTVSVYHKNNRPVADLRLHALNCPSSPGPSRNESHYAGVHHDSAAPLDVDNHGVLFLNSRVRLDDIQDGTSHTLFVGEKHADAADLGWMSGTRATLRNVGGAIGSRPPVGSTFPAIGAGPSGLSAESDDSTPAGPEEPAIRPRPAVVSPAMLEVGGFGSAHRVVGFAFGDGRVAFLSPSLSADVLQRLAHRADGKLLDDRDLPGIE